jgi:hypothetical protein
MKVFTFTNKKVNANMGITKYSELPYVQPILKILVIHELNTSKILNYPKNTMVTNATARMHTMQVQI